MKEGWGVEILATEATLKTLRVEIQALIVSGKQMTLAVFRQLPVAETLTHKGEMHSGCRYWGRVKYTIRDEGYVWAVIEQGGKLYRGPIYDTWGDAGRCARALQFKRNELQRHSWSDDYQRRIEQDILQLEREAVLCPAQADSYAMLMALPQLFIAV